MNQEEGRGTNHIGRPVQIVPEAGRTPVISLPRPQGLPSPGQAPFPFQWPYPYFPSSASNTDISLRKKKSKKKRRDKSKDKSPYPRNFDYSPVAPPFSNAGNGLPQHLLPVQQHFMGNNIPFNQYYMKDPRVMYPPHAAKGLHSLRKLKKKKRKQRKLKESRARINQFIAETSEDKQNIPKTVLPTQPEFINRSKQTGSIPVVNRRVQYNGVSWVQADNAYKAEVVINGRTHSLGLFAEEIRAAVAVDERLLKEGVVDKEKLNFSTQLERDIALIILLNNHRAKQQKNSETAAAALISLGKGVNLRRESDVGEAEKDNTSLDFLIFDVDVSKDMNGHPNDLKTVMNNILRKKMLKSLWKKSQEVNKRPRGPKKMTASKRHKVSASSRQKHAKLRLRKKLEEKSLVGNTMTFSSPAEVVTIEESSEGYSGDVEENPIAIEKRKNRDQFKQANVGVFSAIEKQGASSSMKLKSSTTEPPLNDLTKT